MVLAAVAATLTACTPGRQPLLALGLVDGLPVAFLHACVKGSAEVNVTENTQAPTSPPPSASATPTRSPTATVTNTITPETETYVYSWSVKNDHAPLLSEVPLFTVPEGWQAEKATLNALQKGSRYIADAKLTGVFDVSPVNFTMDELLELGEDEVLYGINAPLTTVLTQAEFAQKAQESCASALPSTTA
jgi:hypothetical protein